jgi:hypothetical protein
MVIDVGSETTLAKGNTHLSRTVAEQLRLESVYRKD